MKWILVAMVANMPVKSDLTFDTLGACLQAESNMRQAYSELFNATMAKGVSEQSRDFMLKQVPWGTCIPSK